ncbi:hypothetical protein BASA60_000260 [Batrachochytrium salamandrivorans]|nr:hypothetical protein BASA60_000260 [Batrachochytrium salamandrivorans]KAH9272686.1 hypothetical protein BASA83_004888 [Batrachochytrium salamandrivorans]
MRVKVLVAAAMVITSVNAGLIDKIGDSIESIVDWVNSDYYWDSVVSYDPLEEEWDEAQDSETTKQEPADDEDEDDKEDDEDYDIDDEDDDEEDDPTKTRLLNDSNEPNDSNDAGAGKEIICAHIISNLRESRLNCFGIAYRFTGQVLILHDLNARETILKPEEMDAHSALHLEAKAGLKDIQKEFKAANEDYVRTRKLLTENECWTDSLLSSFPEETMKIDDLIIDKSKLSDYKALLERYGYPQ